MQPFDGAHSDSAPEQGAGGLYDVLFGDVPANEWPAADGPNRDEEPWRWFAETREAAQQGVTSTAEARLRQVLAMPNLEARHYLQAWHALRALGIQPAEQEAQQVLGVVVEVEVALPRGPDVVAAYTDGSARYLNQSGKAIIWENPDDSLVEDISRLLTAGQRVADQIGPWKGVRPALPAQGDAVRINFLTPSGCTSARGRWRSFGATRCWLPPRR